MNIPLFPIFADEEIAHQPCDEPGGISIAPEPETNKTASRKVAIVEDFPDLCETYSTALSRHGHKIMFVANSGEEALAGLDNGKFSDVDSLVIDYKLGGISGIDVALAIVKRKPNTVVCVISAFKSASAEAQKVGFKFLLKPIKMDDLVDSIA